MSRIRRNRKSRAFNFCYYFSLSKCMNFVLANFRLCEYCYAHSYFSFVNADQDKNQHKIPRRNRSLHVPEVDQRKRTVVTTTCDRLALRQLAIMGATDICMICMLLYHVCVGGSPGRFFFTSTELRQRVSQRSCLVPSESSTY